MTATFSYYASNQCTEIGHQSQSAAVLCVCVCCVWVCSHSTLDDGGGSCGGQLCPDIVIIILIAALTLGRRSHKYICECLRARAVRRCHVPQTVTLACSSTNIQYTRSTYMFVRTRPSLCRHHHGQCTYFADTHIIIMQHTGTISPLAQGTHNNSLQQTRSALAARAHRRRVLIYALCGRVRLPVIIIKMAYGGECARKICACKRGCTGKCAERMMVRTHALCADLFCSLLEPS